MTFWLLLLLLLPLAVEAIARLMIRLGHYYPWAPGYRMEMKLDPRLQIGDQKVVHLKANERGERGGAVDPAAFQVLAVGGSAVECFLLDEPLTWTAVLEQRLRTLGVERVRVGNIGKSAVDSYLLSRMVRYVNPNYPKPVDVLIIMVGASDILLWLNAGAPEQWEGDTNTPLSEFIAITPETPLGWRLKTLGLAEMWRRIRSRKVQKREQVGKSLIRARQYRQRATVFIDETADPGQMFGRFRQYLGETITNSKALSPRVIVTSQPCFTLPDYSAEDQTDFWNGSIGDPYQGEPSAFYTATLIANLMQQLRDHTKAVADQAGVEFVDLTSGPVPNDREHYNDQFHFKPKGAERLAQALAEVILSKPDAIGQGGQ